jgi:hypothetical protein
MTLRETLQAIYASPDQLTAESQLHWWCGRALRSRLEPFRALAKTVRQHWEGILANFNTGLTSAAIEAVNGIIPPLVKTALGEILGEVEVRRVSFAFNCVKREVLFRVSCNKTRMLTAIRRYSF